MSTSFFVPAPYRGGQRSRQAAESRKSEVIVIAAASERPGRQQFLAGVSNPGHGQGDGARKIRVPLQAGRRRLWEGP